ncbi:MAG: tRNA-dihydrouridine synthase [Planctomycetota bacterium]
MPAIGNLQLDHPFTQAALSGFSDLPMRRVARAHGASYTVTGLALERSVLHDGDWQRRFLQLDPVDHPVGAQLMGADPAAFGPAAARLVEAGYDVIDINFGCPAGKAFRRCEGGLLLSRPQTAIEIVNRVVDAVGSAVPVTLKMRRGFDDSKAAERGFFSILDAAIAAGISAVTIHARTVRQRFAGVCDWDFIARVKARVGALTVLGSGDLFTAEACIAMLRRTGVDGVAIARGALGNPWVFEECQALATTGKLPPPPDLDRQRRTIARHFAEAQQYYGHDHACRLMLRYIVKYSKLHPEPRRLREAFAAVSAPLEFPRMLERWYDPARHPAPPHDGLDH